MQIDFRTRMLLLAIADDWKYIARDDENSKYASSISVFDSKPYKENGNWMASSSSAEIDQLLVDKDCLLLDPNVCYHIADLVKVGPSKEDEESDDEYIAENFLNNEK